ncbi:MAG: homoserine dehydrogenase [bacterium]|nr:homoserine dehydrogenase [bacterium]
MRKVSVGLIGCGTVGSGVVQIINEQRLAIMERHGVELNLKKIFTRTPCGEKSRVIHEGYPGLFVKSIDEIIEDPQIGIIIETAGGVDFPFEVAIRSIMAGKDLVTANKALLAHKGQEIFNLAGERGVEIGFEASVAGAIPIIRVTSDSLVGGQIQSITGILNGTTNFILTKMSQRQGNFKKILSLAQEKRFAEADPREDISGIDVRNKLVVLARSAFGFNLDPGSIHTEGMGEIIPADFEYAERKLGSTIKLLAHCSRDGIAFVCPTMVPMDSFLASIDDESNGLEICGLNFKKLGFSGPGAGSLPTASSIVADIVQIAKSGFRQKKVKSGKNGFDQVVPFGEVSFDHTLRFIVNDRPGIISDISSALAMEDISIRAVEQNNYRNLPRALPFLVTLHRTEEKRVQAALIEINKLSYMVKPAHVFRSLGQQD